MPDLPRPARLSLHDAIGYVAEDRKCDLVKAGKAVFYALGEGALIAYANVLNRYRTPGSLGDFDDGVQPVPAKLWAGYPWPWFEVRAVRPRGNPQFREHTADGSDIGPVFANPTLATADIGPRLDSADRETPRAGLASDEGAGRTTDNSTRAPTRQTRLGYRPWLEAFLDRLPLDTTISDEAIAGQFIAHVGELKAAGKPTPSRLVQRRNIEVQVSKLWPKIRARRARPQATGT
jgi:hypothetical protein